MNSLSQKLNVLSCSIMDGFGYRSEFLQWVAMARSLAQAESRAGIQLALEPR